MSTNEIFTGDQQQQQLPPQEQQQLKMSTLSESDELAADNDNNKYSPRIQTSVKKMSQGPSGSFKRASLTAGDADTITPALTPVKEHQERLERERADVLSTSGSEKLQLMRQQLEENKARFARRSTNNQKLMQIVSKIREKMDETQQSLVETSELRRSMTDLSTAFNDSTDPRERHRSVTDLSGRGLLNIDRERNKYLENRVRLLEKQLNKERNAVLQAKEHIKKLEEESEKIDQSSVEKIAADAHVKQVPGEGDGSNDDAKATAVVDASAVADEDKSTDMQVKLEMAKQIQELQNELATFQGKCKELEDEAATMRAQQKTKHMVSHGSDAFETLEATVEKLHEQLSTCNETIKKQEEDIAEKVTELNILNANVFVLEEKLANSIKNKPLFLPTSDDITAGLNADLEQLKQKLDENNKAMIKLKLKCKTYEKQVKGMQSTELQKENARLVANNEELQHKLTELEDEKGQWQLATVDESTTSEVGKQQTEAIRLLEEQKLELLEELQKMQQEKDSVRVKSELTEAQLEEQSAHRIQQLELAHQEKVQNLEKQLSHYISENMELLDKIEKLSKSSSSAESIEIVERLTQQEHAELDEFNKRLTHGESDGEDVERDARTAALPSLVSELTQTDMTPEISENLAQLRDESTELKNKIELFTNERREVLEKMELLVAKNASLTTKVDELSAEKVEYESRAVDWANTKSKLEKELAETEKENEQLSLQVSESSVQKTQLSQELTSLQQSSEVVAALDTTEGATLFDKCERSLSKLNSELEAYRKANDKNAKFSVSKKLAKEAKNVHTQLSELLVKVKEASSAVETVTVVETVVAVTAPNGKALAEYEQLTAQNRELKATVADLQQKLAELHDSYDMTELRAATPQAAISDGAGSQLDNRQLEKLHEELRDYEAQCTSLQSTVEDLRMQLVEAHTALDEKTEELSKVSALQTTTADVDTKRIQKLQDKLDEHQVLANELRAKELVLREQLNEANTRLSEKAQELDVQRIEMNRLTKQLEDFERLLNDNEMAHEKQIEHLTRLRRELEAKCDTYEGEMAILQTLISEQKQQVIEAYSESEHKMNLRLLELQQCHETIQQLRTELKEYQQRSRVEGEQLAKDLSLECESLRESLRVSKALAAQQVNELSNKQETIETLNQQIIELYKTVEESTSQAFDKQDEIQDYKAEIDNMRRGNEEQKSVVDKLLNELHSHKSTLPQLETELQRQVTANAELSKQNSQLDTRCKEQRDKLKKYAANLKKRVAEHQELEEKLKAAQALAVAKDNTNADADAAERDIQIASLAAQITSLEQELADARASLGKLNEDLKHKIHVNLENRDLIKSLKQQLNELTVTQQEQVVNVLQAAPTHAAEHDVYRQELQQQQLVLNERISEIMRLETQLRCATDEAARKDLQLAELHQQLDAYSARQAQLSNEADHNMRQLSERLQHSENKLNELKAAREHDNQQDVIAGSGVRTEQAVLQDLRHQLEAKSTKFEKSKEVIKLRNSTIQTLQRELNELRHKLETQPEELSVSPARPSPTKSLDELEEQRQRYDALLQEHTQLNERYANEKANFELTISRLETLHDGIQAKLQEDMSYIESLESENNYLKTRAATLEESVNDIGQQSAGAVERTKDLETQLLSFTTQSERNEEDLLSRIKILSEHDDTLSRTLLATETERDELQKRLAYLQTDFDQLEVKHQKFVQDNQVERANLAAKSDDETIQLRNQLTAQAAELQRARAVYDAKLAAKATEIDELECELSEHLNRVNEEKRAIAEQLERQQDDCVRQMDDIVRLRESLHMLEQAKVEFEREISWLRLQQENAQQDQLDLQELRMQAMQDKTEIDNLRNQIETLANNHEQELQALRQQLADINTLGQNQTDDQVFIETENKRLTDLLHALQGELQTLRHDVPEPAVPVMETIVAAPPPPPAAAAASIFFDNEQAAPSPFDEIVQPRSIASQLGASPALPTTASPTSAGIVAEQPTIEDLQRNVSDLEKHAQELETKLLARNQLVAEYEERLRELQALEQQNRQQTERQFMELQHIVEQREAQIRQLAATQDEAESNEQQRWATLSARQTELEGQLRARNHEISQLQAAMQERERLEAINKQIQTPNPPSQDAQAPTLDMFFGSTTAAESVTDLVVPSVASFELGLPQAEPVVEELIQPERAYICHPKAETSLETANDWGVDDDPWANAAEATNFTSFSVQAQATQPQTHLETQLQLQSEQIRQLEMRLETAEQQKQELHIKATKLVKKVKELKNQLQQQQQPPPQSFSNDLDIAICDELKSQIDILEAQLAEAKKSSEAEQLEKEKLKKRIDVLAAGNERMSEMKEKQDRDVQMYQMRIRELQERLSRLDNWGGEGEGGEQPEGLLRTAATVIQKDCQMQSLPADRDESTKLYEAKLAELQGEVQDLNLECQELQASVQEEKSSALRAQEALMTLQEQLRVAQLERTESAAEQEKQRLELSRATREEAELRAQYAQLLQEHDLLKAQTNPAELLELRARQQEFLACREQLQALQIKTATVRMNEPSSASGAPIEEYVVQLQERESEILHLKQRIEDLMREDQTEKLVLEILTKNQDIHLLKQQVKQLEEDKLELASAAAAAAATQELIDLKAANSELQQQVEQREAQFKLLELEKLHMEEELSVLNDHVLSTLDMEEKIKAAVLELDTKNIEISELRKSLEALQSSTTRAATPQTHDKPAMSEQQWEHLIEQKCTEIAQQWQEYLAQREAEFKSVESVLHGRIEQLTITIAELHDSVPIVATQAAPEAVAAAARSEVDAATLSTVATAALGDASVADIGVDAVSNEQLIADMKKVLEEQEIEIVTLKEQLAIRSAEYGRLAAQYDPFKLQQQQQLHQSSGANANEDLQKKLDRALYMLHETDMRCEEMTVELGQLLNERDTLQLKLSDTLRQIEILKAHTNYVDAVGLATTSTATPTAFADSPFKLTTTTTSAAMPSATTTGIAGSGASINLNQKLSELQTVNHSKDKVIVDEREQRTREMGQLQKDVANLPPANISTTQAAALDLSPTSRSPSTGLLNWLMGHNKLGSGSQDGPAPHN